MRITVQGWSVSKFVRHRSKINPRPQYQRAPVWSQAKKALLIDTILRGYDVPKVYLRETPEDATFEYEVTDGQQRLRTVWEFIDGAFPLGEVSVDLPMGDMSGKYYDGLSSTAQDLLAEFTFQVTELRDADEQAIRDLFLRLQEGESLNPAEKRNAMVGGMRDFIANLANAPHAVFPLTQIPNKRYAWDDLAAHVACLDMAGGPTDVKAPDLKKFYSDQERFDTDGPVAKRVGRRLNLMSRILRSEPPEMNIKWGFVDLYQLIMLLDEQYVIRRREDDLANVFVSLETDRRRAIATDPADLLSTGDPYDRDLYNYIDAFQRQGAVRRNLEIRRDVYVRRALRDISDLVPLDPTRAFTHNERLVIWRRDNMKCVRCHREITIDEMHADHIVPHVAGGKTELSNAQSLCGPCNLVKSAS